MKIEDIQRLDWDKTQGLIPAVVQHADSGAVLMLGYMNRDALRETLNGRRVVFYSRTRQRLWLKGETSGNYLDLVSVTADCDNDSLLVLARPLGPVCHNGTATCYTRNGSGPSSAGSAPQSAAQGLAFLTDLETIIAKRLAEKPEGSYTARIFTAGPTRMAQKVGEEGVEVALAAVIGDDDKLIGEIADLTYHLLLLMKSRNLGLSQVVAELESRHRHRE